MNIDIDYIRTLLGIISKHHHINLDITHPAMRPLWFDDNKKLNLFVYHMEILHEQGLLESLTTPYLRLTAKGREFVLISPKP